MEFSKKFKISEKKLYRKNSERVSKMTLFVDRINVSVFSPKAPFVNPMQTETGCNIYSWIMWASMIAAQHQNVLLIYDRYLGVTMGADYERALMKNFHRPILLTISVAMVCLVLMSPFVLPFDWASEFNCSYSPEQMQYTAQTDSYGLLVVYVLIFNYGIPFSFLVPLNTIIVRQIK